MNESSLTVGLMYENILFIIIYNFTSIHHSTDDRVDGEREEQNGKSEKNIARNPYSPGISIGDIGDEDKKSVRTTAAATLLYTNMDENE